MVERRVFAEEFRTQRRKLLSEDLHLSEPSRELAFPGFHLLEEQRPMAASCVSDYTAVGLADREWKASAAHLKIINHRHSVEFMASENGRDWQSLAADFDASGFKNNVLHGFQALRPALAASGGGEARFTAFNYRAL